MVGGDTSLRVNAACVISRKEYSGASGPWGIPVPGDTSS